MSMNWLEFWGFVNGALCVWLAVKEHVWNWPVGVENWILWITADAFYIGVYLYKDLYLTALLYLVFLVMCIFGWRRWKQTLPQASVALAEVSG